MAQRFVSGMFVNYANDYGGRFVSRFLVEWLTQVVGWSVVDFQTTKWNVVAASDVGTASAIANDTLTIDSPSYAFTTADKDSYLTITGFTGGNVYRNGIYRILSYMGSAGSTYTLKIYKTWGVHHEGLPIQSGLNWRLWRANDTYCPTVNTEYAVIGGKGNTGAGLANGARNSVLISITQSGATSTLVDTGATFQDSDVGKSITVSGSSVPGNNTTSIIASRVSPTTITFTNASGGNDNSPGFTGSWNITYDFHVRIRAALSTFYSHPGGFPGIIVAPWASWNSGTHTWNDNRYIAEKTIEGAATYGNTTKLAIWAEADTDHFTCSILKFNLTSGSDRDITHLVYGVGELAPFYPSVDPRPLWLWTGTSNSPLYMSSKEYAIIGSNYYAANFNYRDGFRALALNDLTTVTYYPSFMHCLSSADRSMLYLNRRMLSSKSEKFYRVPIIAEARTSGNMEMRGTFRQMWAVNHNLPLLHEQGASGEYLHMMKGIMTPWNGARCPQPGTGQTVVG